MKLNSYKRCLTNKTMNFLITLGLLLCFYSCEKNTNDEKCKEVSETYTNILGKVFLNNISFNDDGEITYHYAITISHKDIYSDTVTFFHSEPWTCETDSILVPLNDLPDSFKIDNLLIVISGEKCNECQVLTQPNWRAAYGCRFRITDIRIY